MRLFVDHEARTREPCEINRSADKMENGAGIFDRDGVRDLPWNQ
jgi:hypothetical protein